MAQNFKNWAPMWLNSCSSNTYVT